MVAGLLAYREFIIEKPSQAPVVADRVNQTVVVEEFNQELVFELENHAFIDENADILLVDWAQPE